MQDAASTHGWRPASTRPSDINSTYIVANERGQVAPLIGGVIHNNIGTPWDWEWGTSITHWMPMPQPPSAEAADQDVA